MMQARADLEQVQAWAAELETLCERIAPHLGRVEVRRRVGAVLRGLLGEIERKNGWQLAEHAGEATPDGIQRLLNQARWDVERVRDELRAYVAEHLGDPGGVLVVDETGFLKKGSKSAGVQRQYSGTAGRIENCQVGVFLAYTSAKGHALVDRELYVPQAWIEDRPRCRAAAIPDTVEFRTKPQLARAMLERALDAGVPFGWVTGDEIYGQDRRLRLWLEARQIPHVLAVKRSEPLVSMRLGFERAETLVASVDPAAWQRVSAGAGAKGERLYDWAAIPIRPLREPGVGHWLLARRALGDGELAYYVCYGSAETSLAELVRVAGARWAVECCFQQAKGEVGLDHYEVRRYDAWYRHITLAMLAHACLAVVRAQVTRATTAGPAHPYTGGQ
jgi:SRSO17 transposase